MFMFLHLNFQSKVLTQRLQEWLVIFCTDANSRLQNTVPYSAAVKGSIVPYECFGVKRVTGAVSPRFSTT